MDYSAIIEKIKFDLKTKYFVDDDETLNHSLRIADNFIFEDLDISVYAPLIIVALLHDVVEDNKASLNELANNYQLNPSIISAIKAITRNKDEEYFVYIDRVKENRLASRVKSMDLLDNIHRNSKDHSFDSLRKRYRKAYKILNN